MSGGSFNYLCYRFDNAGVTADASDMADRLERTGYPDAAAATRAILKLAEGLKDVWQAAEWADSGDWNEDDVAKAVTAWRDAGWPPAVTVPGGGERP